ncbi:MAG: hypothetical protein F4Y27_01595 [Acidimicrobiaceae bacterium]|nr:hypothetical protein [Acidimicrobiaceae bacterium]MYA73361.1 hypothetical protein [Acidimicrobiaceae bacterium]MYD05448.1 hypothetical protein [Acidimicrobiaceae bacterium]MYG54798.1 hypothetical protein [Acidimicrobiaceae bacterium]MYI59907.1 hypothetical protein [Acidimicrobiaceae bacterium]
MRELLPPDYTNRFDFPVFAGPNQDIPSFGVDLLVPDLQVVAYLNIYVKILTGEPGPFFSE